VTAIAIIALGVGATTATFTVLDHVLLRPLPFADPDRIVTLYQSAPAKNIIRIEATPPNFEDWRAMNSSFSAMGAYVPAEIPINLSGQGEPMRLDGHMTGAAVFATLEVHAAVRPAWCCSVMVWRRVSLAVRRRRLAERSISIIGRRRSLA
jgi:hypothetical protein